MVIEQKWKYFYTPFNSVHYGSYIQTDMRKQKINILFFINTLINIWKEDLWEVSANYSLFPSLFSLEANNHTPKLDLTY
jgi:hypothetical protein